MAMDYDYRLDWEHIKKDWPIWVVLAGLLVLAAVIYPRLPARIPSHWNISGQIDSYSSREFGAFFAPLLNIAIYLMFLVIPVIDPKRENYGRFVGAYRLLRWAVPLLLTLVYLTTILVALGYPVDVGMVVKALVAVLMIVIGNLLGQLRFNYFVGVRTPWTLANEEVWRLTHRLSGRFYVVCGLVCLVCAFIQTSWSAAIFFTAVGVLVVIPLVYSYLFFRRLNQ